MISSKINYYNSLIKDTWAEAPLILTILLGLSLTMLTIGVFISFDSNFALLPAYFMILFFEFIWLISMYSRMYSTATVISSFVIILASLETILMVKGDSAMLCWTVAPFLFFSLLQLSLTDNIYKYNIEHDDIIYC